MDDLIQKELEKAMSKTPAKKKKTKSKKGNTKLFEQLMEEDLKKKGYIK